VIGLSGGVDSALTACVAVDALGAEQVTCVFMPTRFSSSESGRDAAQLAKNLGVIYHVVPMKRRFEQYLKILRPVFDDTPMGLARRTSKRASAATSSWRSRTSRRFGPFDCNKSEVSVGYCTLYGDMAGGFALLKDVPKTLVYELCDYVNRRGGAPVIPEYIITRPPSAELREDQKDSDSLPPYEVLDAILELYIEDDLGVEAIVAEGFDERTVRWWSST